MTPSVIIGSTGVGLLLVAFVLNLAGRLPRESRGYSLLNFIGAALACWASLLIDYVPFVILEATWALAALVALFRTNRSRGDGD